MIMPNKDQHVITTLEVNIINQIKMKTGSIFTNFDEKFKLKF